MCGFAISSDWPRRLGFGFARIEGSHHILTHPNIPELLSVQNVRGEAKPYQVRQLLSLIERYDLRLEVPGHSER
jgi:hypothetical protein